MKKDKALLRLLANPHLLRTLHSPKISRSIPARVYPALGLLITEWGIVTVVSTIFVLLIITLCLQINSEIQELALRQTKHASLVREAAYWQEITTNYPGYRDGYFQLALREYQVGKLAEAREALNAALLLDPLFKPGIAFRDKLEGNE